MIELPRACVRADEIAEHADFFSFGTNDLTQTTLGFSRDDARARSSPRYLEHASSRTTRSRRSISRGRRRAHAHRRRARPRTRPDLQLGICGEHGGDPASIAFFHGSASTTSRARPTACRSRGSRPHRPRSPRTASATMTRPAASVAALPHPMSARPPMSRPSGRDSLTAMSTPLERTHHVHT